MARTNQKAGLSNSRATNWAPEVEFSPFRALFRHQVTFPFCCLISLTIVTSERHITRSKFSVLWVHRCSHRTYIQEISMMIKKSKKSRTYNVIRLHLNGWKATVSVRSGSDQIETIKRIVIFTLRGTLVGYFRVLPLFRFFSLFVNQLGDLYFLSLLSTQRHMG